MRFQTPQFIEIEDKIFGPLTFKQFIYLIGGAGLSFLWYRLLPTFFAIWLILASIALAVALAFYKINNKPFIFTLEAAFRFALSKKLYIWRKDMPDAIKGLERQAKTSDIAAELIAPRLSESKLKDMAWGLDAHKTPTQEANQIAAQGKQ